MVKDKLVTVGILLLALLVIVVLALIFVSRGKKGVQVPTSPPEAVEESTQPPRADLTEFPKDLLPIYPSSTATRQVSMPQGEKKGINAALLTVDSPQKVNDFYQKFLKDNGWQVEANQYQGEGGQPTLWELAFEKGKAQGKINITQSTDDPSLTEIVIVLTY